MNKMKKLLSVVLAVVLALSAFSIMGSAAKTTYKTVAELTALDAYSPYGQVTRLSAEERTSIVFDALDNLLASLNINMGTVIDVLGLTVKINLTNIDNLCESFDSIKSTFNNTLFSIAKAIVDLGVLESLNVDKWETGMSRDGTENYKILSVILNFLDSNTNLVNTVLTDGLDLGIIAGFLGSLDLSSINEMVTNVPGLIKGLVYPMIERWDDTLTDIKMLDDSIDNASGSKTVEYIVNWRVKELFNDDMSITTIKYDANGNMTSEHEDWLAKATGSAAPGTPSANSARCYYQFSSTTPGSVMTVYHIVDKAEAKALAKTPDKVNGSPAAYTYFKEAQTFVMSPEVEGSETYVWKATDEWNNTWSLKWYNDESPFLPGFDGSKFDLATMSAGDLLYTFIPVVFENMAPVVLNGSVKKALAAFVGVEFTYVGQGGPEADDAVLALPDASDAFFTQEQGEYLWEWSDYKVINGNHYYRFEDQIFAGDTSNKNNYFDIINWDFKVTGDFMDEFVPANDNDASVRLLNNVTKFLNKVGNLVLLPTAETADTRTDYTATWVRPDFSGDNADLVNNIKELAQAIVGLAPQHIFGDDYATNERCYVELMLAGTDKGVSVPSGMTENDVILTGIAAHLVDMIMPSMSLPGKTEILNSGAKVGAILAAVVREFAAYLAPEYNFDALIYTSFDNGTKKFVSGKDSEYWFDVILTMGINVGYEYLRAFADMGEGTSQWNSFVAASGYMVDGGTYTEAMLKLDAETANQWEAMVDYIVDWALTPNDTLEWCWAMGNIVDTTGLTINLATVENPWVKLDKILDNLLPIDEIISVDDEADYRSGTELEKLLRYDLILGIVDLRWDALINLVRFDQAKVSTTNLFRKDNVLDSLALLLKSIVNGLLKKADGGSYKLIPDAVTDFDTLANQGNLKTLVTGLIGVLYDGGITNKFANTLLPFLNFLLGWKTDPQIIRDMVVWTTFRDGNDYAFQWTGNGVYPTIDSEETQIHILNNSAGMLETHRNSSVTDHAYDIEIKSITSDATVNTLTFDYGDGIISPFETLDVKIGGKYVGEEAATITIAYDYVGKNGQPIGERQYMTTTILFSNQYEDSNVDGRWDGDDDDDYTGTNQYKKYVFTEDLYTSVTTYEPTIFYVKPSVDFNGSESFTQICANGEQQDCNGNITNAGDVMTAPASNYFEWIRDQNEAGWEGSISDGNPASGRLYKAKSGVTANTFSVENSEANKLYGDYDMGNIAVQYGGTIVFEVNFIYYNDYDIGTIYDENVNNNYHAYQGVSEKLYNDYINAWNDIVYYAKYPMMTAMNDNAATAYVTTIQPKIPAAIETFEAAKEAYEEALAEADASGSSAALPSYVVTLQAEIDNDIINKKEINFQDYNFYEYFNYNDVKVEAEKLYRTYLAPEVMDSFYINGSGIREAELNLVIDAEANSIIAAGIEATKEANDQAAIDASQAAKDEWKMPTTSKLVVDDFTSRLSYYKQFLEVNAEPMSYNGKAAHLYFLEKEIAFVEAQNLNEDDYTEASWEAYAEALDIAKKVAAGNDPEGFSNYNSRIYDVKYNLMVAYKNLLLGDYSLIEQGGTADLNANIAIANDIFASLEAGDGVWMLAEDYEGSEEDAYAALIRALGYEYQAMYSENDIEVEVGTKNIGDLKYNDDGSPMMFNLYSGSALEYANNDRPNRQGNQAKVDNANAALEAAIANFESAVSEPELIVSEYGEEMGALAVKTDMFDEFVGVIFGIDTYNGEMIADYLETSSGSIEIIPTDLSSEDCPGTGSIINLLDDNGDIVESYVFVLFGDVNGDGFLDSVDAGTIAEAEGGLAEFEAYYNEFAADYDGNGYFDSVDSGYVAEFEAGLYEASQAEIAAEVFVNYGF